MKKKQIMILVTLISILLTALLLFIISKISSNPNEEEFDFSIIESIKKGEIKEEDVKEQVMELSEKYMYFVMFNEDTKNPAAILNTYKVYVIEEFHPDFKLYAVAATEKEIKKLEKNKHVKHIDKNQVHKVDRGFDTSTFE